MKKYMMVLVGVFTLMFVVGGATAAMAAGEPPPVNFDTTDASTIAVSAPLVTLILSLFIPVLNGFLTTPTTPVIVKSIGTIVLNTVAALLTTGLLADGTSTFSSTTLYTAVLGSVISIAAYAGVYKPINVTSNAGGKLATVGRT
jgi:hypothetical protein